MGKLTAVSLALALLLPPQPVGIRAYPVWGFNLSTRVTLTVEPDPANKELCWSYDSGDTYSSSCWKLDGEHAPHTTTKIIENMKEGVYILQVDVLRSDGKRHVATTKVCSLGPDVSIENCNPSIE